MVNTQILKEGLYATTKLIRIFNRLNEAGIPLVDNPDDFLDNLLTLEANLSIAYHSTKGE